MKTQETAARYFALRRNGQKPAEAWRRAIGAKRQPIKKGAGHA